MVPALPHAAPATLLRSTHAERPVAKGRDWQNDYADFAVSLKQQLKGIPDAEKRRPAIAQMREVLAGYQSAQRERDGKR